MVADMLAHTKLVMNANSNAGVPTGPIVPYTGKTGGWHILQLKPNALADLKAGFEKLRQLEVEAWRAGRAARKASSAGGEQRLPS